MVLLVKNLPANAADIRDADLIPGLGRSLEEGNGNPLQYSGLENFMDRGAFTVLSPNKPQGFNPVNQAKARCGVAF